MKKKIILITGSSGFIGNHFLKHALHKKYKIIDILRNKNRNKKNLKILRRNYKNNYETIFYSKLSEIKKKIKNRKINYFVNFATLYKNSHLHSDIPSFIKSNILFPSTILDLIDTKICKIINFGTMMQHVDGKNYSPKNFYASTKSAFEMILNYYFRKNRKLKFYNLKFYESFSEKDNREKLIPTLIKNHKKNKITKIISSNLELNIIHVSDIIKAIDLILNKEIKSGNYCLKQKKNTKVKYLISLINKNLKTKIKVQYLNNKKFKPTLSKIQPLPKWKPDFNLEEKIRKQFFK